ncbi:hypothetical protein HZC00_01935 [Candidatus Kaiserbacteria bacterium]|nr:hypothetical protein [Candidatus Kaiserbacteria bacterium]
MNTVTLPKYEYETLAFQAKAYRAIASVIAGAQAERPIAEVVARFAKTKKYSKAFLADLEDGLADLRKSKAWKSK